MTWTVQTHTITFSSPALPEMSGKTYGGKELRESMLTVRSVEGREAVGEIFGYKVLTSVERPDYLLDPSDASQIDLEQIVGSSGTVAIEVTGIGTYRAGQRGDAGRANIGADTRYINGKIVSARIICSEDRATVYEFVLRPSVWRATQNRNSRIFSGRVDDVLSKVLNGYGLIDWRLGGPSSKSYYPYRDFIRQAWESDWNLAMRLMEEWGFFFWFEHTKDQHALVISDSPGGFHRHGLAYETLRYHQGGRIDEEHISELALTYTLTASKATVNDHDYMEPRLKKVTQPLRESYEDSDGTASRGVEIYAPAEFAQPKMQNDWHNDAREEGRHLARVKLQAARCVGLRAHGKGHLRGLQPGRLFTLAGYPQTRANRGYIVLACDLNITEVGTESGSWRHYTVNTSFELHPDTEYYRLPQVTPRPHVDDEYAVIVTPQHHPDQHYEMFVDDKNRVLIQYDWDREAKYDGATSIRVRVASQWQGSQMGVVTPARAGQMVIVSHVHGDPDRPYVSSFVVDRWNMPPWELPRNSALSGIRSQSLGKGSGSNHVVLDDTDGQMQAQIASDYAKSSLTLGFNTRIDGNKGLQDARGEGFELRTDKWGAVRAALGVLVTSFGRANAQGKAKDMAETTAQLTQARSLHEQLADVAHKNRAQAASGDQRDVAAELKQVTSDLRGQPAARERAADFPEFEKPHLTLTSAAGLQAAANDSLHLVSGEHTALTAGKNISLATGRSLLASAFEKISLYAHRAGVFVGAQAGDIRAWAQTGKVDVIAKNDVSVLSENGSVRISADKEIVLTAGGSRLVIGPNGVQAFTPAAFLVHAGSHATEGPMAVPSHFETFAPYPMEVSCSALSSAELPRVGAHSGKPMSPAGTQVAMAPPVPTASATGATSSASAANTSSTAVASAATTAPPAEPVHTCTYRLKDIPTTLVTMSMESGDYWGVYEDGSKFINPETGQQYFFNFANMGGSFDIGFDAKTLTITAKVIILVRPKRMRQKDPAGNLKVNPDGTPYHVPFDSLDARKDPKVSRLVSEDRPVSDVTHLPKMKAKIEQTLNQNGYRLAIKNCPKSAQCSCTVAIKLEVEFLTKANGQQHTTIDLYPQATRADSANWAEENVVFNSKTKAYQPVGVEQVQAHEVGHLFSFPDEYFDQGGTVHRDYIDDATKQIKVAEANASSNREKWLGNAPRNLMGIACDYPHLQRGFCYH